MRMKFVAMAAMALFVGSAALPTAGYAQSCSQLHWACENKGELGLEGAGLCRRYREMCGQRQSSHCQKLQYACEHKGELGIEGAGACRRFREACGG